MSTFYAHEKYYLGASHVNYRRARFENDKIQSEGLPIKIPDVIFALRVLSYINGIFFLILRFSRMEFLRNPDVRYTGCARKTKKAREDTLLSIFSQHDRQHGTKPK